MLSASAKLLLNCMDRPILLFDDRPKLIYENRACRGLEQEQRAIWQDLDSTVIAMLQKCLGSTAAIPFQVRLPSGGRLRFSGQRIKLPEWQGPLIFVRLDPMDARIVRFQAVNDQLRQVTETLRAERRRANRLAEQASDLHRQVETDQLTYLLSRAAFEARVTDLMARGRATASVLISLDLNEFKAVNDTYGHLAGDIVLIETGKRICSLIRDTDLAARFGGDEFCLLLHGPIARKDAEAIVSRLDGGLKNPVEHRMPDGTRVELQVSASIGAVRIGERDRDLTALLHAADAAMYNTKRSSSRSPTWFGWEAGPGGGTIRMVG